VSSQALFDGKSRSDLHTKTFDNDTDNGALKPGWPGECTINRCNPAVGLR